MKQKSFVRLRIISETHDAEHICQTVGMSCDRFWKIGDKRAKTAIAEKTHGWVIESQIDQESDVNAQIRSILKRVWGRRGCIRALANVDQVMLSCAVYGGINVGLYMEHDVIQGLAEIGAGLDVDVYALDDEE